MCALHSWRSGVRLAAVFLVASVLASCSAGPSTATLLDPPAAASPLPVSASDDVEMGRQLFTGQLAVPGFVACIGCHSIDPAGRAGIGPNLAAVAQVAAQRAPGMTAAEYIERSIRVHDEFVVPGYSPGIVRGALGGRDFNDVLSDDQVAALVAYLMSLPANTPGANPTAGVAAAPAAPQASTASPQRTANATATALARTTATASATPAATASATPTATTTASATSTPSVTSTATPATTATATASATVTAGSTSTPGATPAITSTPTATAVATVPPSPTPPPAPTPAPVAAPTAVAAPATPTPAPLPSAPDDPNLARYAGCVSCHNQHPQQVRMPHPLNPTCNECHRGSPNRIGCPTCHSMHAVDNKHEPVPDLACATCHR